MRAIQLSEQGGPEVLRLVELPNPEPGPGQVLIHVEAAAVNFSDVMRRRGDAYPEPTPLPFVPGAEVAGTVTALGEGVASPTVGTRVFGTVGSGGYAELVLAPAAGVIPIPDGLDADTAAGVVVSGLAATIILDEVAHLAKGETVFVPAAAGGVGGYAVQIAKLRGATVIAGASTPAKRDLAAKLGADHVVDYTAADWTDQVLRLTGGRGVDVALDMTGPERLARTLTILAPFARLVVYGNTSGATDGPDPAALRHMLYDPAQGQSLIGFNLGTWFEHRPPTAVAALQRLIEWVTTGRINAPQPHPLPLGEAAEAHRRLESGTTTGKLVLEP